MKWLSIFGVLYAITNPAVLIWLVPVMIVLARGILVSTMREEREHKREEGRKKEFNEKHDALTQEQRAAFHVAEDHDPNSAPVDKDGLPDFGAHHRMQMRCFKRIEDPAWVESVRDEVIAMMAELRRIEKRVGKRIGNRK